MDGKETCTCFEYAMSSTILTLTKGTLRTFVSTE